MALTPGTRLGAYEVTAQLGAGGMGEVYRAHDTTLGRDVALKVLPEAFAADADRVARFQREAKTLAALNHPHIAQIYGLEDIGAGGRALVMELVEGDDLSQRIARGPMPLDEALPIAKQIADALEAAHEQGIIHRDLKPANIKVRPDGTVKVLDFGLAKAMEPTGVASPSVSQSPTISPTAMTQAGMILGTAAYMSPEQTRGKPLDKRTDIWAFGCVLYEMLTGKRAFEGEGVSDTLATVLKGEPDWAALPATLPPSIRALIEGCLRKDRTQRIGDISAALFLLNQPMTAFGGVPTHVVPTSRPSWRRALPIAATAIVVAGATAGMMWMSRPVITHTLSRFVFTLPDGQVFTSASRRHVALSPDGTQLVYVANRRLYRRLMADLDARPVVGTQIGDTGVLNPVFSPDGRSIAFYALADSTIKRIAATGGAPVTICQAASPYGMTWDESGIWFGNGSLGIMRVSATGGTPEIAVKIRAGELASQPQLLPDGRTLLFTLSKTAGLDRWDKSQIVAQSLKSGERRVLVEDGFDAQYVPTGHIIYARGGVLFAVRLDLERLQVIGAPVPMVEGVRGSPGTGAPYVLAVSNGSLAYVTGPISAAGLEDQALVRYDRTGALEPLKLPPAAYEFPRVSPDGKQVAFGKDDGKETAVWIYQLSGASSIRRLTFGGRNRFPVWSPDSQRIAFQSDREGDLAIFWQRADGSDTAERLTKPERGTSHVPQSWSSNDDVLLYSVVQASGYSLWALSLKDRKVARFDTVRSSTPVAATFSPDSRWVAYTSDERGSRTIYVQPVPATGAKYQISKNDDGHHPMWSPDGKELFYVPDPSSFAVVTIATQPSFTFGDPVSVPRRFTESPSTERSIDITPDGKWFVAVSPAGMTASGTPAHEEIIIILNWFEELKARVPTK